MSHASLPAAAADTRPSPASSRDRVLRVSPERGDRGPPSMPGLGALSGGTKYFISSYTASVSSGSGLQARPTISMYTGSVSSWAGDARGVGVRGAPDMGPRAPGALPRGLGTRGPEISSEDPLSLVWGLLSGLRGGTFFMVL